MTLPRPPETGIRVPETCFLSPLLSFRLKPCSLLLLTTTTNDITAPLKPGTGHLKPEACFSLKPGPNPLCGYSLNFSPHQSIKNVEHFRGNSQSILPTWRFCDSSQKKRHKAKNTVKGGSRGKSNKQPRYHERRRGFLF